MSLPLDILLDVLDRMKADPPLVPLAKNVRMDRRTILTRDNAPAVHVIPGESIPGTETECRQDWKMTVTLGCFVRDDAAEEAAAPLVAEVLRRLDPRGSPTYPWNARLKIIRVRPESDIADGDALRTDIECQFDFISAPWDLDSEGGE